MDWEKGTPEEHGETIRTLHAAMCAIHRQLLADIAAADDPDFWRPDGAHTMADWLQMFLKISRTTALDWVRAAGALETLPATAEAHATGVLSFDQVRALTKCTTPESDAEHAQTATEVGIARLEAYARKHSPVSEEQTNELRRKRTFSMRWNPDKTWLSTRGGFPADEGVLIETAVHGIASRGPKNEDGSWPNCEDSYADAMVELASTRLADTTFAATPTVVVHIDADVLTGQVSGNAVYEEGQILGQSAIEQLVCDCQWVAQVERANGEVLGIGQRSRQVPWWLRQRITHRDDGCRWPGCNRTRWLHCHHIIHVLHGGRTDEDNLLLLCGRHHNKIHNDGWTIEGDAYNATFHRPDGRILDTVSHPLRPEIRERLTRMIQPWLPTITPAEPLLHTG